MSSRHKVAGGITVRGHCSAGHLTEATSDPGRTTWEGPCAHDGCDLTVKATRRPSTPPASAPDPAPADTAPATDTRQRRLRQVDYDRQPRRRDQPANPATDSGDAGRPDDTAAATAPAGAAAVHRDTPDPATGRTDDTGAGHAPRSARVSERIRERITGRRQAQAAQATRREFRLPY